jgi:hypothetical protein
MPESTLSETTLAIMLTDAATMKSELHVRIHVEALVAEVRRLRAPTVTRPSLEAVQAAQAFLDFVAATDKVMEWPERDETGEKALAVIDRFFS